MKKLITILAIMIVLVGAIFAETATTIGAEELIVKCTVTPVEPLFTLYGSASETTSSTSLTSTGLVLDNPSTDHASAAANTVTVTNNAIIDGDVTVYFVIKQTNDDVKSNTKYKFTYDATALSDLSNVQTATATVKTKSDLAVITAANNSDTRVINGGSNSTGATVQYKGLKVNAADLLSFNVVWNKTDLPPATYSAYVTLTITTTT
ncbi:MAG: hypothetical protein IJ642_10650 [Oscillospiraceae bacterium]|nr:hypothetical protein [Oscillospiraceae bacterium]